VNKRQLSRVSNTGGAWLHNLSKTRRSSKQALSVLADTVVVLLALWGAYTLRGGVAFRDVAETAHLFLIMPGVTVLVMASLGTYRWVVRSSNQALFVQLGKACVISAVALALFTYLFPPQRINPRSIFIIYGLLLGFGTFSTRVSAPDKQKLADDLDSLEVSRVILAMPALSGAEYESKVALLTSLGCSVQTIPTYAELMSGEAKVEQVRDISITDILGRSEVPPDPTLLGETVTAKVVLVTGAGGSIGSEMCRQIVRQNPAVLIGLDHSEENLYKITEEINSFVEEEADGKFLPVLCSVTDADAVNQVISANKVETIIHAAAYKHVPIVEVQPEQGLRVNVFGTMSVLNAAIANNVQNFVLISTDKAVRPTNAMGASKRIAEMILQAKSRQHHSTRISMVRFGNVLGSSGSVVPKFKKQIEEGGR